ncbi:MAG: hypothetical protein AVDCRST_MAG74-454 [uncultured Pyrinomonadaceae bacterium]|uniref:Protein kinase domain-containing protein n=1 Tax=uncultured Pyrinomonadaceae bacterium TaxID=2283094 RepID=A0A6J4NEA0_9BACT|nr:MAG: hypothetical protein AVDCRST_MAG74-454 [uncultured Pyrinomonadaceae bacterium]
MPTYYDSQNNAHVLNERIGSGGEGAVFFCGEDFKTVAKIYHEPISEEKAEKLRWMAAHKNDRLLKVAAWVVDVLTDAPGGTVVGFLMPSVKAKEIHELYSLKSRRVYFPEATWHFLVHTAANVARAFYNLHCGDHVMGDVNHGNCVVLADGTVKLIDCDSYSIRTDKMRYPCEVGVATHLAPELQGANLRDVERLANHDNFGLAVIIFQLLFLGRHPFAGNYLGGEDKSIEDCIREYRFAYGDNAALKNVRQPPGTLPLDAVSPRVALMFERAFITEARPEPREWIEALEDLANSLEQCALHPGHLYFNRLAACPWCEIEAQTGLMLFPFVTAGAHPGGEKPFNIFTVENLIANLGISNALPAKPPPVAAPLPPTAEVVEAKRENRKKTTISLIVQFFGLIFLMAVLGVGVAAFFGMCALIVWLFYTNNSVKYLREELEENLSDAQQKWAALENEWARNPLPKLDDDLSSVKKKIAEYQKFQQTSVRRAKHLREADARRRQHAHLRSARLADAEISGIREKQIRILLDNNFETAADMDSGRLRYLPEIGARTIAKLLDWRREIETNFNAEPDEDNLREEQMKLAVEAAGERRRIEREIENSLISLRSGAVYLRRRGAELSKQAAELASRLAQTKSDAKHLGTNSPAIVGLILITFLTPYFGFIVLQINHSRTVSLHNRSGYGTTAAAPPLPKSGAAYPKVEYNLPKEDYADLEIAIMPDATRTEYAENLLAQTSQFTYETPDYKRDERKMRLAIRLQPNDTRFLNQLGYALYEQQTYNESLKYLNRSLKIESENSETKIFIGINYLRMERFKDARQILTEVTDRYDSSFEGFYNLGLAHSGLKHYAAAIAALRRAAEINPGDADTRYQLGYCFYKSGETDKAYKQYEILLGLDKTMADKLYKEAKIVPRKVIVESK